jgi:hypothetical protein
LVFSNDNPENNSLLKNAFIEDCNLTNSGANSWSRSIQNIQNHFKITDLTKFHTEEINTQIKAITVNQTGKLSFYSTFSKNYKYYPNSKLSIFANFERLRISAH